MQERTHIDLTKTVAEALGWPGNVNLLARNASFPDEVKSVEVHGLGYHVFGNNLASLCHFGRPGPKNKEGFFTLHGYCWKLDRSKPGLDLPNRTVIPHAESWGEPAHGGYLAEPMYLLASVPGYKPIADEISYAAASTMADWATSCFKQEKLTAHRDALAGWVCHFAQDLSIPHHVSLMLLNGHCAFEADVGELYLNMRRDDTLAEWIRSFKQADNCPEDLTVRRLCELTAESSHTNVTKLEWSRMLYPFLWRKAVRNSLIRGILSTVQAIKVLQRI